ncbi:hypothetical protein KAH94_04845, partial [bacterium]|nr:hypothetical protein [bacterium]
MTIKELKALLKRSKAKRIYSSSIREKAKLLAQFYFRKTRQKLINLSIEISELDECMQDIIEISNKNSAKNIYYTLLNKAFKFIIKAEKEREYKANFNKESSLIFVKGYEKKIYQTLLKFLPSIASSYKQVALDLSNPERISFRGTISEMRETLREVLDYLAPDDVVIKQSSFKLEKNCKKPTMKQKARFILTSRGMNKTQSKVPEGAISILEFSENKIASLIRDLYGRESLSMHTKIGKL